MKYMKLLKYFMIKKNESWVTVKESVTNLD